MNRLPQDNPDDDISPEKLSSPPLKSPESIIQHHEEWLFFFNSLHLQGIIARIILA